MANFLDFSGVNHASPIIDPLFGVSVSWNRIDFVWDAYEPTEGNYNEFYFDDYVAEFLFNKPQGMSLLPMLGYNALWAGEDPLNQFSPLAVEHIPDWVAFVTRAVQKLSAPPYNFRYFQIWNEAHPLSGYWTGTMTQYMERIHLPAAQAIRANGGKVVYGGWPAVAPLSEYIALLDAHSAWSTIDVLDMHYFWNTVDFQQLYDAAVSRGFPNMAIWQTEIGWTPDQATVGDVYPLMFHWAIGHNWVEQHRYKLFWFRYWSPDDPLDEGYNRSLYSGDNLTAHGRSLQTLSTLFDRGEVSVHSVSTTAGRVEGFAMLSRVVVAVHVAQGTPSTVTLTLPKPAGNIAEVERVDLANVRQDIKPSTSVVGSNLVIVVSTTDSTSSPAYTWNQGNVFSTPSFFVSIKVELNAGDRVVTSGARYRRVRVCTPGFCN